MNPISIETKLQTGVPDVEKGGMGYFLVVTKRSKGVFGAYYFNEYPLRFEDDCPDSTKENGFKPCKSCEEAGEHICTGWYEENNDRDSLYFAMADDGPFSVIAWAEPPANPLHEANEATP